MAGSCVLVANEPRAYREVLAAALGRLLPYVRVVEVDPAGLTPAIGDLTPDVVICSRFAAVSEHLPIAWMVLYPEGTRLAIASVAGERSIHPHLDLPDLLIFVGRGLRPAVGAS
jgi:hypothetical protein